MTATLQADNASGRPILLRVDYSGGHGLIGATKSKAEELTADEYSSCSGTWASRTSSPRSRPKHS